ncbi:MAG: TolC family protein [bacterium]
MSIKALVLSLVFSAVSLSGCMIKVQPDTQKFSPLDNTIRSTPAFRSNQSGQISKNIQEPSGVLTLRESLSLALMKNPSLAAFSWEMKARDAARIQAALLPNPELNFEIENFAGSSPLQAVDQAETTISLGQLIEMAGKRSKRERVASLNHDLAGWDYETRRVELFTDVTKSFISVLGDQQKVSLSEDLLKLARQVAETVSKRVNAGKVSPVEEIKANVALASSKIDLDRAKKALRASRKFLAAMWGNPHPKFQSVKGVLDVPGALPEFDQLIDRLSHNPELARWAIEVAQRKAVISLEKANAIPDITIGGGFRQFNESDATAFVAGISIDLPVFNRNQGSIGEARAQHSKAIAEQDATVLHIKAALTEAYRILSTTHVAALGLKNELLPGAERTFEAVNEGYRLGKFDLLDVLDAQRTLAQARAQYLQAQIDHQQSLADVEQLIGERLDRKKFITK